MRNWPFAIGLTLISTPALGQVAIPSANPQNRGEPTFQVDPTNGQIYAIGGGIYKNIVGNATTVIKTGAGFLHTVTLGTMVASETVSIYDNTAGNGTLIANLTEPSTITSDLPSSVTIDAAFATGLTVVTVGGAASDVTVSYH